MKRRAFIVTLDARATIAYRLKAGELGIDIYGVRGNLKQKGLVYRPCESEA